MGGFRVHGEKIRDRAHRPAGPRLHGLDPDAPTRRHVDLGVLGDEPDETFRPQSLPDPAAVDGVGGVELVRIALPERLPHLASVEDEDIEVAKRRASDQESRHGGRKAKDD